jgi:GTPase Era involved in 16S rRNA processing
MIDANIKCILLATPNSKLEKKLEESDNIRLSDTQRGEKFKEAVRHLKDNPTQGVYFASMSDFNDKETKQYTTEEIKQKVLSNVGSEDTCLPLISEYLDVLLPLIDNAFREILKEKFSTTENTSTD